MVDHCTCNLRHIISIEGFLKDCKCNQLIALAISLGYSGVMPSRSYPWSSMDYAASLVIADMMSANNTTLRDIVAKSDGQLRYNRVRDIVNAEKAPVRISEFALICEILDYSPIEQFAKICQDAKNIQNGYITPEWKDEGGRPRSLTPEELQRPPFLHDELIDLFTQVRENPSLEISATKKQ